MRQDAPPRARVRHPQRPQWARLDAHHLRVHPLGAQATPLSLHPQRRRLAIRRPVADRRREGVNPARRPLAYRQGSKPLTLAFISLRYH